MLQVRRSRVFVQVHKVSRRGPQRRVSVAQDFRALIAGRCVPPRRSGRRRAAYRTRDWVTSLFTELPRRTLLGNSYTALPSFYFTAVTVRRGTTSVDGVQNFPAYFRYEFFSATQWHKNSRGCQTPRKSLAADNLDLTRC